MWMKIDYGYVNYIQVCMKCTVNVRARLHGHQCTVAVHVDDLLITSNCKGSMSHQVDRLRKRYGSITCHMDLL